MLPTKRAPTHPGEILVEEFLRPLGLSQEQLVKHLGKAWTQPKLSDIINKKRRITEAIALDFADVFGTTSELWLNLQSYYDLWFAKQMRKPLALLPQLKQPHAVSFKKK